MLASHLWWQTETAGGSARDGKPLCRDGKRVLECLQKALRIATNCIDELTTVQLYVDALDKYIYYLERGAEAVRILPVDVLRPKLTDPADHAKTHQQPCRAHYFEHRQSSRIRRPSYKRERNSRPGGGCFKSGCCDTALPFDTGVPPFTQGNNNNERRRIRSCEELRRNRSSRLAAQDGASIEATDRSTGAVSTCNIVFQVVVLNCRFLDAFICVLPYVALQDNPTIRLSLRLLACQTPKLLE